MQKADDNAFENKRRIIEAKTKKKYSRRTYACKAKKSLSLLFIHDPLELR